MTKILEKVGAVELNLEFYSGVDHYSDGEIENVLLEIVKNNESNRYNRIIADYKSWPILYHLSDIRTNIVSLFPITNDDKILEIGAGCGAITGALLQKSNNVTCIELSKRRSLINAHRNKNIPFEIIVGNFQHIYPNLTIKYDYITLIGVFEYAASYIGGKEPYKEFLQIVYNLLKPNGKLIIAIENRMGLKYFSGAREDHLGTYFSGIENDYDCKGVRTFSKNEWNHLFDQLEDIQTTFYYPYPDYKFPLQIYTDNYLPKIGDLNYPILNLDGERTWLFDENKVFNTFIDNKVFPVFSNSFLIEVQRGENG